MNAIQLADFWEGAIPISPDFSRNGRNGAWIKINPSQQLELSSSFNAYLEKGRSNIKGKYRHLTFAWNRDHPVHQGVLYITFNDKTSIDSIEVKSKHPKNVFIGSGLFSAIRDLGGSIVLPDKGQYLRFSHNQIIKDEDSRRVALIWSPEVCTVRHRQNASRGI